MSVKFFNQELFQLLQQGANESPRRRLNHNIHQDLNDPVQRLFITLMPDSYVRPHRHSQLEKWECFLMLQGQVAFLIFDESGKLLQRYELNADGPLRGLEIPANTWHTVVPGDEPATFFEVKQGPYQAMEDKDFAAWAPIEGPQGQDFLSRLKSLKVGQSAAR
ncbi:WbuC family cupin fold metalloprotein [Bowmanella denitrificans]|uniref:WbuC family cupin fold metalloprotein n=1 Tax=Bowmanella denitrificans TaxID=366582 RepID=UPI000C9A5AE4|nr:WbuC family cupin fold metalloprotein [Bowmanella denitrificans]